MKRYIDKSEERSKEERHLLILLAEADHHDLDLQLIYQNYTL